MDTGDRGFPHLSCQNCQNIPQTMWSATQAAHLDKPDVGISDLMPCVCLCAYMNVCRERYV